MDTPTTNTMLSFTIGTSGDSRSEEQGVQSSKMNVGLCQICWNNKKHNGLVYYASIMG